MLTILVSNPKVRSRQITLATNLASYDAGKNVRAAIMDYDPQGSSMQ